MAFSSKLDLCLNKLSHFFLSLLTACPSIPAGDKYLPLGVLIGKVVKNL
jgi:hypothetical protein